MQCLWRLPARDKNILSDLCHTAQTCVTRQPILCWFLDCLCSHIHASADDYFLTRASKHNHLTYCATLLFMLHSRKTYYFVTPVLVFYWWERDERFARYMKGERFEGWSGKLLVRVLQIKCLSLLSCSVCANSYLNFSAFLFAICC